jgi:hypothetical protein
MEQGSDELLGFYWLVHDVVALKTVHEVLILISYSIASSCVLATKRSAVVELDILNVVCGTWDPSLTT